MNVRDIAYAIVKKMKSAYTTDGCNWQSSIEAELASRLEGMTGERDDERVISKQWEERARAAEDRVTKLEEAMSRIEWYAGSENEEGVKWDKVQDIVDIALSPATKGLWDADTCGRLCEFECGGICDMTPGHEGKHHCGTRYAAGDVTGPHCVHGSSNCGICD